ncbi:MAG: hypothetical protein ACREFX_05170 [Opitutaceae bacterium]
MPARPLSTEALVLEKRPAASDGWERLVLFSPEEGPLSVLRRQGRRAGGGPPLDLFDEASVVLESSNEGGGWFLREARVGAHRPELGRSYACLQAASRLARVAARNPVAPEGRARAYALVRDAFEALAAADRPDVVLFKSLFRFARDEGYPVKQEWRPSLGPADRQQVDALLERPVRETALGVEAVARLQRRLEDYLRANTEILLE